MAEKMSGYCYVYLDSGSHTNALVNGGALRRPAEAKGRSVFDQLVMGRTLLLAETTLRAINERATVLECNRKNAF